MSGVGLPWALALLFAAPPQPTRLVLAPAAVQALQVDGNTRLVVPVDASAGPRLLLLRQASVDVRVSCDGGAVHNAPTGRVGFEAVVLERSADCEIASRMPAARRGTIEASVHDLATPVLGADRAAWRALAAALRLDDEAADSRNAALAALATLLAQHGLDAELRLALQFGVANLQRRGGQHAAALASYGAAAALAGDAPHYLAPIHNGAGLSRIALREHAAARLDFEQALAIAQRHRLDYEAAAAQNNLCLLLQHADALAEAARCYQDAAAQFRRAGEHEHGGVALSNWAFVAQRAGDAEAALAALEQVHALRRQGPQQRALALTTLQLASLHGQLGRWDQALQHASAAVDILRQLGVPADIARAYRTQASVLRELGQPARALGYLEQAEQVAAGDSTTLAPIWSEHAALLGRGAQASALRQAALAVYQREQSAVGMIREGIELARDAIAEGQLDAAAEQLDQLQPRIPPHDLARHARYALARAELALARPGAAEAAVFELPISAYRALRDTEGMLDATLLAARWQLGRQRPEAARALLFGVAEDHARALRSAPSPALAASYQARHRQWKDLLVATLVAAPAGADELAPLWAALARFDALPQFRPRGSLQDWRRYRLISAQLRAEGSATPARQSEWLRELDALEQRLQVGAAAGPPATLADWQRALGPADVLLRYLVGADQGVLLRVQRDALQSLPLPGRAVLAAQLAAAHRDRSAALALSRLLLPGAGLADPEGHVLVLPDDGLHAVPFAALALQQPELAKPLVVVAGTGIPDLQRLQSLPARFSVVDLALPARVPLPGTVRARRQLAAALGDRLQPVSFDTPLLLPPADVVHMAGHGWFHAAFPGASALSGEAPGEPLAQTLGASDLRFATAPRLLVLSACEVAGTDAFGAGLSLARVFAERSGALVLGPTTPVDDGLALRFDQAFFAALEREPPAHALRSALRALPPDRRALLPGWQLLFAASLSGWEEAATADTE